MQLFGEEDCAILAVEHRPAKLFALCDASRPLASCPPHERGHEPQLAVRSPHPTAQRRCVSCSYWYEPRLTVGYMRSTAGYPRASLLPQRSNVNHIVPFDLRDRRCEERASLKGALYCDMAYQCHTRGICAVGLGRREPSDGIGALTRINSQGAGEAQALVALPRPSRERLSFCR